MKPRFPSITPLPENPSVSDCVIPCPTNASCISQAHSCYFILPPPLCSKGLNSLDVLVLNSKKV